MATTIHHSTIKSAEKQGIMLEVEGAIVRALIPSIGVRVFGVSGSDAIKQANAARTMAELGFKFIANDDAPKTIGYLKRVSDGYLSMGELTTPVSWNETAGNFEWQPPMEGGVVVDKIEDTFTEDEHPKNPPQVAVPPVKRSENGVALDGATAYKEGVMAADNPFEEGTDEADAWDAQWDQAADESPEGDDDAKGGSVVASRYRTKYAEQGHPTHCGDWLAQLLNNFCIGDKHTDLEVFEKICDLNGVKLDKYNRTTPGWQGRIRMTGRNLLSRKVFDAKHINVPNSEVEGGVQQITAPGDWLSAQRFNKPNKAE